MKGLAGTYGLNQFSHLVHRAENILDRYRKHEMSFETGMTEGVLGSDKLRSILEKMVQMLGQCERIINKIVNQGRENAASIRSRHRENQIYAPIMEGAGPLIRCQM